MKKEDYLYEIIKKEGKITSKRVNELGYHRIFLTFLLKQKRIYKIARGVYSANVDYNVNPLYEFQKNNKQIIYSCFTALNLLGFSSKKPKDTQISVPQGYNASRYQNCLIFYNSASNYNVGVTKIETDDGFLRVYELERCICDIIKNENRFDSREYNKLINYYFNRNDINYQKLLNYSKLLKVSNKVQKYLSLFKA
jgi:hypothetical protein